MNKAVKVGIAGTGTALLVLGGFGAYNLAHGLSSGGTGGGHPGAGRSFDPAAVSSSPPSDAKAVKLARTFLDDWAQKHLDGAASDTDAPRRRCRGTRTVCT
ncbi:hypothetical protein [Streptomyces sp. NBC_01217]|uniref:hypothetical protein n=1 Tax=Streptomyces sp. NBC_01217 TaxID=2903779 RepID=UPI002E143B07|nr:hypothetical protein OG507_32820 [Streptomyces sp. NBC_01217]